jgi:hypothetical protein
MIGGLSPPYRFCLRKQIRSENDDQVGQRDKFLVQLLSCRYEIHHRLLHFLKTALPVFFKEEMISFWPFVFAA